MPMLLLWLLHLGRAAGLGEEVIAAPSSPADSNAFARYLQLLRQELHLSLPAANISVDREGVYARDEMQARALVMSLPAKYVMTVQKALGSGVGSYINKRSRHLPRTIPRHFVLAMWVLYEKHAAGDARSLWHAWINTLPPLDNCTYFWSQSELEELEHERAIKMTLSRRKQIHKEYESLVKVLLDGGLEDALPAGVEVTLSDYAWAVHVVTRYALHLAWDFPIFVPLSIRLHPISSSEVFEFGEQHDPSVVLYASSEGLGVGSEITASSDDGPYNENLLLHAGYVWDEMTATRPRLLLSEGSRDLSRPIEQKRRKLRDGANWSSPMEFEISAEELNPEMLAWLRLSFANEAELDAILAPKTDCDGPLSPHGQSNTEEQVTRAVLATIDQQLAQYDHSVEEDEQILEHIRVPGKKVSPRLEIAVTYRRLCKQVLFRTSHLIKEHHLSYRKGRLELGLHKRSQMTQTVADKIDLQQEQNGEISYGPSKKLKTKKRKKKANAVAKDDL